MKIYCQDCFHCRCQTQWLYGALKLTKDEQNKCRDSFRKDVIGKLFEIIWCARGHWKRQKFGYERFWGLAQAGNTIRERCDDYDLDGLKPIFGMDRRGRLA